MAEWSGFFEDMPLWKSTIADYTAVGPDESQARIDKLTYELRFSVVPDEQLFEGRHERFAHRNLTSSTVSGLIMNELFIWKKIPS